MARKSRKRQQRPKPPLGTGERFRRLTEQLARRRGVYDPRGLAAWIGRQKYGKRRFQQLASRGRRRAARRASKRR